MLRNRFSKKFSVNREDSMHVCTIRFLDDSEPMTISFQRDMKGQYLFDYVCQQLNLLEVDCFGLRYVDSGKQRHWLDLNKSVYRQLKYVTPMCVCFRVKYYPTDPLKLKEEITRYFLFLQLRRDLHHGRLLCSNSVATVLAAFIIQSEIGDYDPDEHLVDYVTHFKMLPKQTAKQEERIAEIHKTLISLSPAKVEASFLLKAASLDTYGVDPHPVKDQNGNQIYIGVTHLGILTFQGSKKTHVFKWPQITKVTFEGKMFIVHITATERGNGVLGCTSNGLKKHAFGFKCPTSSACKHLWKCAVEQRYFFTLQSSSEAPKVISGGGIFSRGSKFRFSGRCEKEAFTGNGRMEREEPRFIRASSNQQFVHAYISLRSLRSGSVPNKFNALGLSEISLDDPNQKDRLSQSLDDISMLSTPRHKSADWRQTICRDEQNTARFFDNVYDLSLPHPKGFKNSTEYCNRDPRDNSANKSSHANHPDAMVVDRSNQERNQINSCHLKRIDTASVASETEILHEALLENCVFLQSSGSVTQAASPMSVMYFIMSSQRTVICCWSMVIAVFVLVTVVVLVTILVFELDVDYPLVREIRLLPEVQVFKQMRYDLVRKKFFNIFG